MIGYFFLDKNICLIKEKIILLMGQLVRHDKNDLVEIQHISKLDYQFVYPIELHDQFDQMIVRLYLV
jgi:hypothetical protein